MSDRRWLRHGVRIRTTEYRRTLRGLRQDSLRLFLVGGAVLAVLAVTAFLVLLMRLFLADLEPTPLPAMLAGLTVPFWGTIVYLYAARALSRTGRIDAESLMLTTTSTRAVVTGLVIAELLRGATYLALPTIILAGRSLRRSGHHSRCSVSHSRSLHSSRVLVSSGTRLVSPARRSFRPHRSSLDIKPSWNWSRSASHGSHLRAEFWPDRFRRPCVGSYRLVY